MIRTAVISVTASFVLFGACRGGEYCVPRCKHFEKIKRAAR
jgi:hypothetical protein